METRAAPSLPTPRHSPATACYWTTSNIGLSGQNHQHQHPTAGDKDSDNDNEKNKKNENNKNRNKHSHDGNQYSNDDNNKRTTSTACNFTFTPSNAPHGQIALPTAEGFLNWAPVRLTLAVPCSLSTQPHLLTGTSFEGKLYPPTPRPSSRGRRAGRTKPKLDLEKEWQWVARSMFLQPNQYLISTSIQPRPNASLEGFSTSSEAHYRSIQPRPNAALDGLAALTNSVAQGRYVNLTKAKASSPTHPLLLAGSKVHRNLQTKWPLVAPQSCWSCCGSAVSDACWHRAVTCRLRITAKAKASSPTHPLLLAGS